MTKVFGVHLTQKEKLEYLSKNKAKKSYKNRVSESDTFLRNDYSLAFFYIRNYYVSLKCENCGYVYSIEGKNEFRKGNTFE